MQELEAREEIKKAVGGFYKISETIENAVYELYKKHGIVKKEKSSLYISAWNMYNRLSEIIKTKFFHHNKKFVAYTLKLPPPSSTTESEAIKIMQEIEKELEYVRDK